MNPENPPVTLTLNPAIDETIFLDRLQVGEVNRSRRLHSQAGGKGINVSRMLSQYGIPGIASGFLGGDNPELFTALFQYHHIQDEFIRIPGKTRTGFKIVCGSTQQTTDINSPGLTPSKSARDALLEKINNLIRPGRWFVLAGSLPEGLDMDFFCQLIETLKKGGALVAVDTSGAPLKLAIEHKVDLIKPNGHELAEVWGHPLQSFTEKVEAARELQKSKVPRVILSLGSEGAVFLSPEAENMASAAPVKVVSTVGAGDALLSGYLAGVLSERSAMDCARLATVFAWCNLENVERILPPHATLLERMQRVQIQPLSR